MKTFDCSDREDSVLQNGVLFNSALSVRAQESGKKMNYKLEIQTKVLATHGVSLKAAVP